ncbi:MAG TPA: hypothetical protein VM166_09210 [Gemmatimonadaceae bacterium]|nr:hypothetical protein [Gemmatimonadaceae bacterium]
MTVRRAELEDKLAIDRFLVGSTINYRLYEIILEALTRPGEEYIAAISTFEDRVEIVGAYGMVAGTLATAALYGVFPLSSRMTELLSFAAHDLKKCGAEQIVAEFPDTDDFKPYRDVLLESGFTPTGLVEDFYRDGIAMVILTRKLTA